MQRSVKVIVYNNSQTESFLYDRPRPFFFLWLLTFFVLLEKIACIGIRYLLLDMALRKY